MLNQGYYQFAEALDFVHGNNAEGEAARHAILCERSGDGKTAGIWRKIQCAVRNSRLKQAA